MNKINFKYYFKNKVELIDKHLESIFTIWSNEITQTSPRLTSLFSALKEGCEGGKRIRGVLVLLGYSLASQRKLSSKDEKAILDVAAAYEIFQTAILTHDDIIDKSEMRRGKSTIYRKLGNNHYGISQAICIGDLGFFMAYRIVAESRFSDAAKARALAFFSDSIAKTILGEMLDVEFANKKSEINEKLFEDILTVYKLKTAYYTFIAPLTLGAIFAGADEKKLQQIKLFGENIGIVFQIFDDISDIFETAEISKKDTGADIKEGKITLLYTKALQNANVEQRRLLSRYYGKALTSKKVISEIQNIFLQTGALREVELLADTFEKEARKLATQITKEKYYQQILEELIDYVCKKEKKRNG